MKTGYRVCDAMTQRPISVEHDESIVRCARIMAENHVSSLLVKKANRLMGLLTEKDIVRKVTARMQEPSELIASQVMEKKFPTIKPEKDISDAISIMGSKNVKHLPVMNKKTMVGFLTGKDILKLQPNLFEVLADKIELREWERKNSILDSE